MSEPTATIDTTSGAGYLLESQMTLKDARRIGALLARLDKDYRDAARTHARLVRQLARIAQPGLTFAALTHADVGLALLNVSVQGHLAPGVTGQGEDEPEDDEPEAEAGA
jgi:hypothetical protein